MTYMPEMPEMFGRGEPQERRIAAATHIVADELRMKRLTAMYRAQDPNFARWAEGYGVIQHTDATQVQIYKLADELLQRGAVKSRDEVYRVLYAADRVTSAALWLVVHMTYACKVYRDARNLEATDFKRAPDGHTGGSLNMVPAYVGYLAINALTGHTRGWLMGQGHCVAAVDAANLLVGNTTPAHAARYDLSEEGLTRFVHDFYSYELNPDGTPASPLGSHVNPHTAGGLMEGGYPGFAELQYVHIPLPGERLVAFLSDGAFEEQRGGDWAPRWWRTEDCGLVAPIMIANGRRIDQRTTAAQGGGLSWLMDHLRLNGFEPITIDGRDPAAFVWAIDEMEQALLAYGQAISEGRARYPVPLHYAIAEAPKGYGFPGAGTHFAHNLPLGANPAENADARRRFHAGAHQLWVHFDEVERAVVTLNTHERQGRPRERDNPIAARVVPSPELPAPMWRAPNRTAVSPMEGIDHYFATVVRANRHLRPRFGNPDEARSNRMNESLDLLKHRVTWREAGVAEAIDGKVITVLNEEAVVNAALGNKGGINITVTYEAFGVKMLGSLRQEIIFARHQRAAGREPGWISMPVVLTSHTWENGKNEQSHQDPTLCEVLLGEMADVSRVWFAADWNSAVAGLRACYGTRGEVWTLVVPKQPLRDRLSREQADILVRVGGVQVRGLADAGTELLLVATGAYQLEEALTASWRLEARGVTHAVIYLAEPGRFRYPRDKREEAMCATQEMRERLFPPWVAPRVFLTHTRPAPFQGVVRPLDTGVGRTSVLGFINHSGTLDLSGMLFANRCTWAHALVAAAESMGVPPEVWLDPDELAAVQGRGDPIILRKNR